MIVLCSKKVQQVLKNDENGLKIESQSPSKTSIKDPFHDPEVLSQFVQEVEKFEKFVEGLSSKTLNGPTPLDIKWNELKELEVCLLLMVIDITLSSLLLQRLLSHRIRTATNKLFQLQGVTQ